MSKNSLHNPETSLTIAAATDAFSSGQVGSKLWLCEQLEAVLKQRPSRSEIVWIYGGWNGVLGFMLLTRGGSTAMEHHNPLKVRSFDIDPASEGIANAVCENWVWREWQFRAFTADCNELNAKDGGEFGPAPTIVINTSVEHFEGREWFEKIPEGTMVVLQASDFEHDGAVSLFATEAKLAESFRYEKSFFRAA